MPQSVTRNTSRYNNGGDAYVHVRLSGVKLHWCRPAIAKAAVAVSPSVAPAAAASLALVLKILRVLLASFC